MHNEMENELCECVYYILPRLSIWISYHSSIVESCLFVLGVNIHPCLETGGQQWTLSYYPCLFILTRTPEKVLRTHNAVYMHPLPYDLHNN